MQLSSAQRVERAQQAGKSQQIALADGLAAVLRGQDEVSRPERGDSKRGDEHAGFEGLIGGIGLGALDAAANGVADGG